MTPTQTKVLEIIAMVSGKPVESIQPQHELTADLGIDSPKSLQLMMELEERLEVDIEEDDAARLETVQDILNYVAQREKDAE